MTLISNMPAVEVDETTETLIKIDSEHHEIHEGDHYFITGFQNIDTDAEIVFGVKTSDSESSGHITTLINGTSEIEVYIYEDAVFTGGTPVIPINNNRNSLKTSGSLIVIAPTVTDVGTLLSSQSSGKAGVNPKSSVGGITSRQNEIILKRDTYYIFKTISKDDDNIISFRADWYEHISKAK